MSPWTLRPRVGGKFLFLGDEKLFVRGVTYGAFAPDAHGNEYHDVALSGNTSLLYSSCALISALSASAYPKQAKERGWVDVY